VSSNQHETGRNIAVLTSILAAIGTFLVIAATLLNIGGGQHVIPWFLLMIFAVWAPLTGVGLMMMARSRLRDPAEAKPPSLRLVRTVALLSILYGIFKFSTAGALTLKLLLKMNMVSWFLVLSSAISVFALVAGLLLLVGDRRAHSAFLALIVLLAVDTVVTTGPMVLSGMISAAIFSLVFAFLPLGAFLYAYTVARAQVSSPEKST
jgi:hypothetical protein